MTAFDEICSCGFETTAQVCMCVRRKWQARDRCEQCLKGRHRLMSRELACTPLDDLKYETAKDIARHDE